MSTKIKINNREFTGRDIKIQGSSVWIDGELAQFENHNNHIDITVFGDVERLLVDSCDKILVTDSVRVIDTLSGNVDVRGSVNGDIKTASGNVKCGTIYGSVSTMSGNITQR